MGSHFIYTINEIMPSVINFSFILWTFTSVLSLPFLFDTDLPFKSSICAIKLLVNYALRTNNRCHSKSECVA